MLDIKLKEENKGIKAIDKAATLSERMKSSAIKTKEKAENGYYKDSVHDTPEEYATDDATAKAETAVRVTAMVTKRTVKKGTKRLIRKIKQRQLNKQTSKPKSTELTVKPTVNQPTAQKTAQSPRLQAPSGKGNIKTTNRSIKQTAKDTIKTVENTSKTAAKTTQKTVKTAEKTSKAAIKTTQQAAKAAGKAARTSAKAAQKAAQATQAAAKAAVATTKAVAKAVATAVKAIIAGTKALIAVIAAGGWIAIVVIIVICLVALIIGSCFGIFFSGEDSGTGQTMRTAVQEINTDYDNKLDSIQNSTTHDTMEMSGSRAVWKEVLAVYSVKVNTDSDNPQEVATMDDTKNQLLKDIFWEMNSISSRSETNTETEITETDDGHGNIVQTESTVTKVYLYITVNHKTVDEMAAQYGFNQEQKKYLADLLKDENNSLWASVLYGISTADGEIVSVALSQIGNVGGQPYWSWYGFNGRAEWCACFVSWCANECGYLDAEIIPKYAEVNTGAGWFKDRGQWMEKTAEPAPGTIIFFDWDDPNTGGQDGSIDHTGIVEKVEDGRVWTVEGNSGDTCREKSYLVGYYEIYGYGVPAY